jgi:hypothetical protein
MAGLDWLIAARHECHVEAGHALHHVVDQEDGRVRDDEVLHPGGETESEREAAAVSHLFASSRAVRPRCVI